MTNVKLKLMFFLLSALLTADIVHARPYSDNNTDIVYNYNSNDTYLPVEANTDTLIVKYNEEEVSRKANNNMDAMMTAEQDRDDDLSKKVIAAQIKPEDHEAHKQNLHLDEIITAEQDRDRELSKKINKDQSMKKVSRKDADSFEKQMNISSPFLEELIDSETDREETLTDILFRGRSESFVEPPRFEFLIAAKINESELSNRSASGRSENALERGDKNSSDILRKVDYVELVEVLRPGGGRGENKSAYNLLNITANEVDNDLAPDTILSVFSGFTDMQTLLLACFGTLLPLLAVLCAFFFIRCLCRRCCPGCCSKKSDISESDSSEKNDTNQQIKSEEAGDAVENGDNHAANGSIFTMTLKNNHLIVETEERNDFTKNGRETKMKYSPDNDGIFVVEVQQSAAYRPNNTKSIQISPPHDPQISTNQALIHRVPEELEKKLEEDSEKSSTKFDKEKALALSSTGLSISDLSMSSIGSHNVSYSYGSQMGYEHGPFGYPIYAGYDTKDESDGGIVHDNSQEPLICRTPTDPDRPVVTAAIFKQDSLISNDVLQGQTYCIEGSSDGPLLSDAQSREVCLQNLQDKKLENGVAVPIGNGVPISEKIESARKPFNRADSLPVRLHEDNLPEPVVNKNPVMDVIKENEVNDTEVPKDFMKGKRASLPIIRTDMYESVKDVMMPVGSPKFELLMNDGDGMYEPPMITITEEEPGKSDS